MTKRPLIALFLAALVALPLSAEAAGMTAKGGLAQAMAEAKKNGLKVKGKTAMSLLVMGQATKNPCACWSVVGGFEKGDVSVLVDGKTGKFSYKQTMP